MNGSGPASAGKEASSVEKSGAAMRSVVDGVVTGHRWHQAGPGRRRRGRSSQGLMGLLGAVKSDNRDDAAVLSTMKFCRPGRSRH